MKDKGEKIQQQLQIKSLIVFDAIMNIVYEMPKKMPPLKLPFLSGGKTRFSHLGSACQGRVGSTKIFKSLPLDDFFNYSYFTTMPLVQQKSSNRI